MKNHAEFVARCPDEDFPLLRELLSFHCLCPASCPFRRNEHGQLYLQDDPSPLHWSRQAEWPWALKNGDFQKNHTVLDVGGGWSILKYPIAKRSRHVVCIDNDKNSMERAQETTSLLGVENVSCQFGDACDLPFLSNTFDRVCCISVLEHVEGDKVKAVQECIRVLKPGGIFLLSFDLTINGPTHTGFGINQLLANTIYQKMEMPMPPGGNVGCAYFGEGANRVQVAVLMAKYYKPS